MAITIKRTKCIACNSKNNLCWFYTDKGVLTNKCMTPNCPGEKNKDQYFEQKEYLMPNLNTNNDLVLNGRYEAIEDRGLSEEICRKYLTQVGELNGKKIHIYNYTNKQGDIISQKIRFVETKEFIWRQNSNEKQFFGTKSLGNGLVGKDFNSKTIYICEGELDCLSLAEIGITNTVSISTGAGDQTVNEIKKHLEWLEQFEKIILVFDNDKVGQDTARDVLKLFTPGKGYNVLLGMFKDPNEYVKNNKQQELLQELNNSIKYIPEMIVIPKLEKLLTPEQQVLNIKYPELNQVIKGIKPGRIYTLLAGSGVGKSSFTREILYQLLQEYNDIDVGAVYLEEPVKTTALGFIALENNIPLYELEEDPTKLNGKFEATYDKYVTSGRVRFVDASFMKLESKELINTLNFLAIGLNCQVIVLDHLTMVTYDMSGEQSERKDIDMLMKSLRELTHKTQCSILLVSHLKRPVFGKSWAEGREVNMTDCRGSAAIEQLSDVMIGLERNMINEFEKNKTKLKVLKNRITGKTGYVDELYYDEKTGRLISVNQMFK